MILKKHTIIEKLIIANPKATQDVIIKRCIVLKTRGWSLRDIADHISYNTDVACSANTVMRWLKTTESDV